MNVVDNLRNYEEFSVFEIGNVFKEEGEIKHIAGAIVGKDAKDVFLNLKGVIENMNENLQIEELKLGKMNREVYLEERAYLNILSRGKIIGSLGLLSKKAMVDSGIKNAYVGVFEIDFSKLVINQARENKFKKINKFPNAKFDLSMILPEKISWNDIKKAILKEVQVLQFIDEYKGKQIPQR